MVDAAPLLAALSASHGVALEVEDRQVEVAVAQVIAACAGAVDFADFLQAEHVDVEAGGRIHVLGGDGDMFDLRHGPDLTLANRRRRYGPSAGRISGKSADRAYAL